MTDPMSFLDAVSGYAQHESASSASRVIRLATIDPAYVATTFPGTLPKVTFDGETVLSGKRYAVMSGYLPRASDRVVLIPVGTTFLIIGSVDADTVGFHGDGYIQSDPWVWDEREDTADTSVSTTFVSPTNCGLAFVAGQTGTVLVFFSGTIAQNGTTIAQSVYMGFEVRTGGTVGSGTVHLPASDANSARHLIPSIDAGFKYGAVARLIPVTGLTPGSTYNVRTMHRTQNNTMAYQVRHVVVMQTFGPLG